MEYYVGLDISLRSSALCIVDSKGKVCIERESPVVCADDAEFTSEPQVGAMFPEARIGDGYLTEKLGAGFSVIVFDERLARELDIADVVVILIAAESEVAQRLGAKQSSAYLVRPDLHIAARLFDATPATIQHTLKFAAGEALP